MFVEELFENKSVGPNGDNISPRTRFKREGNMGVSMTDR